MYIFLRIILLTFFMSFALYSETHITGDITGMTFESSGNPYIVEQDILIPAESKAVIRNGCIFLFKPFTGLTVHGHLVVDGTQEQPVIFSSINDGEFNPASEQLPNPFDWNGILVSRESGTVSFQNFVLRFSVYGIKSQNSGIALENGLFRQNGQFHFTINDKIQFVQDNIAYSYNGTLAPEVNPKPALPENSTEKKASSAKKIFRYTSLGVGIIGTAGAVAFGIAANNSNKEWIEHQNDAWDKYRKKFYRNYYTAIAFGITGGVGLTGFSLTFVF